MFTKLFGPSWQTTVAGYATLLITASQQVFVEQGWPKNGTEWITFTGRIVIAIGLLSAKDKNVSNAPVPMDKAVKVE